MRRSSFPRLESDNFASEFLLLVKEISVSRDGDFSSIVNFINQNKGKQGFYNVLNAANDEDGGALNIALRNNRFSFVFNLIESGCIENVSCGLLKFILQLVRKRNDSSDLAKKSLDCILAKFIAKNSDKNFDYFCSDRDGFRQEEKEYVENIFDRVRSKNIAEPAVYFRPSFSERVASGLREIMS